MPSKEQVRKKLISKLKELFQLNQPDLDFGFYRIMHAKARQTEAFIENDLLAIIQDAFGATDEEKKETLFQQYQEAVRTAKGYGAPDPENTPAVKEAKAKYEALSDHAEAEIEIYQHLYRFFERYYDDGDFISRRYFTRETPGKAAPFAVPYHGEEVKLHWANADQYYIKTTDYFSNYSFDISQNAEIQKMDPHERILNGIPEGSHVVHFRLVDATEGEHGNVKASENDKRFFIIHRDQPINFNEQGELICNFEYRSDPDKTGQEGGWREKRNFDSVNTILHHLQTFIETDSQAQARANEYIRLFTLPAPTESDKSRPLLAKYIHQYTARNTMDYFIHKDLGSFLRRELDFYIKNEMMRLDDIEDAEAPAVEAYLSKIKVLRKIASKLIAFLAQLEDFQKKLWLKKKFVVETNYCITLDRIPEELYPQIACNEAQCEEWIKLFTINEIQGDLHSPGFSQPLSTEFLIANDKLVLDTRFFDDTFKARLIASIDNFDEQCDGLLIHSENFQALNLLQDRYREQVKCVYIDPPYNTGGDGFAYKDSYQHSSWLTLIQQCTNTEIQLLHNSGAHFVSIDEVEVNLLKILLDESLDYINLVTVMTKVAGVSGSHHGKSLKNSTEYVLAYSRDQNDFFFTDKVYDKQELFDYIEEMRTEGKSWKYTTVLTSIDQGVYLKSINDGTGNEIKIYKHEKFSLESIAQVAKEKYGNDLKSAYYNEVRSIFRTTNAQSSIRQRVFEETKDIESKIISISYVPKSGKNKSNEVRLYYKDSARNLITFLSDVVTIEGDKVYKNISSGNLWTEVQYNNISHEGGVSFNNGKKPIGMICKIINLVGNNHDIILDYFAGSGTTGHAVINLNREDGGNRKYILVEMGGYFDTVLKPRIAKVVYSEKWKEGKPIDRNTGISHCFKYIRLESYEDTLNNLRFDDNPQRVLDENPSLKEDYMLHYMLDVETNGSQSLLNIDAFADPNAYHLEVKKPGSDKYAVCKADLMETFNYLIGLRVVHIAMPQNFQATFDRTPDPELPEDQHTKLVVKGRIQQDAQGSWWFRKIEGWVPKDPMVPNNGLQEKVLIVWRKLTGNLEQDNLMLDEWFQKNRINTRDFEFDTIYVNGSNNLPNLKLENENWKVRLIEEEFMKRMWDIEGI